MNQLQEDLERFNYTVITTTDNLLPSQNELSAEFSNNAQRIKALVHLFSPGILKKVSGNFETQKEHTWFNSWFGKHSVFYGNFIPILDQGMNKLRDICNTNGMQKICVTVFAEFEGGKSKPTEIEKQIKDKIETELAKVNSKKLIVPTVELSKSFKLCLPVKNGLGPYEIDRDYQS